MAHSPVDAGEGDEFVDIYPTGHCGRYDEITGEGAFKTVDRAFVENEGIEVARSKVDIEPFLEFPSEVDEGNKTINMITELFTSRRMMIYLWRKVEAKAIKNWWRQIVKGIHYLHSHNPPIIHGDLNCHNVFMNGYSFVGSIILPFPKCY
ncbi:hypothetical protein SAY86_014900 [Trapa natans]|uniref:non-specific serine/threonine protein kinase n=1 Tax=Trapa natans TaxID=22666 RepID=A0AAN7QJU9_TRANT|nr:hypothetical protein SAY86_014900 [Trapa natans]